MQWPNIDLILPVGVCLAYIIGNAEIRDLLVNQCDLNAVVQIHVRRKRARYPAIFIVKSAPSAHCHAAVRDADIVESLEAISEASGLSFHEFDVGDDVLYDRRGYLCLHISIIIIVHANAEAVCKKVLFVLGVAHTAGMLAGSTRGPWWLQLC